MYKILASDGHERGPIAVETIKQWIAEERVEKKTPVMPDGATDWVFLESLPEFAEAFASPPPVISSAAAAPSGSGLNAVIPYKNVRALAAYYFAIFSIIPILGMPLGFAGCLLGILGLRFRTQNPAAGGRIHAWIGIVLGGLCGFGYLALISLLFIAAAARHKTH